MSWLDSDAPEAQERANKTFDLLPAGWMVFEIVGVSDYEPTRAGNGHKIGIEMQAVAGEHKGRKLWANFNVDNPNPKAVQIAKDQLLDIADAVGVKCKVSAPQEIVGFLRQCMNLPLEVKVAVRKSAEYGDSNEAKAYRRAPDTRAPVAPASTGKGWR